MQPGQRFADRYVIQAQLGQGGMGEVYQAWDERLGRLVALKLVAPGLAHDPQFVARFDREAATMAVFEHPNVVRVYDYNEAGGVLYLVMQYVAGRDLGREIAAAGGFDLDRTVEVVRQIAAGLDAAHRQGHVHRDVKPGNVLLGRDSNGQEQALLTDFGLALPQAGEQLTASGSVLGTFGYMAPEQLRGERATVQSDIYALACLAFQCLSGRPPFTGDTEAVVAQHLTQPPPDLSVLVPGVPRAVAAVVAGGLAKDPAGRPATAGEFAAELAAAATTGDRARGSRRTTVAAPHGPRTQVLPPVPAGRGPSERIAGGRRRGRSAAGWLLAALLLGGAVVGLAVFGDQLQLSGGQGAEEPEAPAGAELSEAQAALAERLPDDVFTNCAPHPEREDEGRVASLTCESVIPGADELLVAQWRDGATMAQAFQKAQGRLPDGKCGSYDGEPRSGLRTTWTGDGAPMACYINSQDDAILMWEYPDEGLQMLAVRQDQDAQALFQWWERAVQEIQV